MERARRAHAMKNCLSVIFAVTKLVENEVTDRHRERLERALAAVGRLKDLIDEDLDPPSGTRAASLFSVSALFEAVRARALDVATRRGVELEIVPHEAFLRGDSGALVEALTNLVVNAVRASAPGDVVSLCGRESEAGRHCFTVGDSGCGMSAEALLRYGQPWVTSFEGGTGLGVATAREVFDSHGGVMQVESTENVGTTVTIWLPAA